MFRKRTYLPLIFSLLFVSISSKEIRLVPQDYKTISEAIEWSNPSPDNDDDRDLIVITEGTIREENIEVDRPVVIRGDSDEEGLLSTVEGNFQICLIDPVVSYPEPGSGKVTFERLILKQIDEGTLIDYSTPDGYFPTKTSLECKYLKLHVKERGIVVKTHEGEQNDLLIDDVTFESSPEMSNQTFITIDGLLGEAIVTNNRLKSQSLANFVKVTSSGAKLEGKIVLSLNETEEDHWTNFFYYQDSFLGKKGGLTLEANLNSIHSYSLESAAFLFNDISEADRPLDIFAKVSAIENVDRGPTAKGMFVIDGLGKKRRAATNLNHIFRPMIANQVDLVRIAPPFMEALKSGIVGLNKEIFAPARILATPTVSEAIEPSITITDDGISLSWRTVGRSKPAGFYVYRDSILNPIATIKSGRSVTTFVDEEGDVDSIYFIQSFSNQGYVSRFVRIGSAT